MPPPQDLRQVEARTQELGRALFAYTSRYRGGLRLRLRDYLLGLISEDDLLRTRLLRFVDVLGALDFDRRGELVHRLLSEYFGAPLPGQATLARRLLRFGSQSWLPTPLVAWAARAIGQGVASTFLAPANLPGVRRTLRYLESHGRRASLDLLGELVLGDREAARYCVRYLDLIADLASHPLAGKRTPGNLPELQLSLKLSSLVADFNPAHPDTTIDRVRGPLIAIADACRRQRLSLTLDMEQYEYRDLAWQVFTHVFGPGADYRDWEDVGIVVQAYLQDAQAFADEVVAFAKERAAPFQVRLVKGAYWDYETIIAAQRGWPTPVFEEKAATDLAFESIVWTLLDAAPAVRLAIGSHNLRSHAYAEAVRERLGLPDAAVEHQTLYRTAEEVSAALARLGWVSRDYVPSGDLLVGMSYLVRRMLENASQVGFLFRSRVTPDIESLLRAPQLVPQPKGPPPPASFRNHPPRRLFLANERSEFGAALRAQHEARGSERLLRIGDDEMATNERVPALSPSSPDPSHPLAWLHRAGLAEAKRAIAVAATGARPWAGRSLEERAQLLERAAALLADQRDTLASVEVLETGKPWPEALADVDEAIDYLRYYPALARELAPHLARYRPHGVVAVIPPWNFPAAIPAGMTAGALVTGNAVILKSAEQSALVADHLVRLLHRAGVPADALIHLPGQGETVGRALVESPDVAMVAFTGSREVGRWIHERVAQVVRPDGSVKRALTEMGGKNTILVFADADLDEAVQGIMRSAFGYAGQKCSACSRVLIERPIFERLKSRLIDAAASLALGPAEDPGTFLPPVINDEAYRRLLRAGEVARGEGRILLDRLEQQGPGYQLGPLLVELEPEQAFTARTAQEELFGPILAVMPFDSEEGALRMANATSYALTAGIFSRSPSTIDRVARALEAGDVYVNREVTGARVAIEPFGGFKLSGTGPQAGGSQYLWAFVTPVERRADVSSPAPVVVDLPALALRPWRERGPRRRAAIVRSALDRLAIHATVSVGATGWSPSVSTPAVGATVEDPPLADWSPDVIAVGSRLLARVGELADPEPTLPLPGQRTYVSWEMPRGVGLAVCDDGARLEDWLALVLGPLLAGNGLLLLPAASHREATARLVDALHAAGVPRDVLDLSPLGPDAAPDLADLPIHFAACDLAPEAERRLAARLAVTPDGQPWLKARLSLADGPSPDEPGFLRRFALPKAVSIRTLHHGAALQE